MDPIQLEKNEKYLQDLEAKIADLKKRWPAHSVPAALMQELDDLEAELTEAMAQAQRMQDNA